MGSFGRVSLHWLVLPSSYNKQRKKYHLRIKIISKYKTSTEFKAFKKMENKYPGHLHFNGATTICFKMTFLTKFMIWAQMESDLLDYQWNSLI